MNTVVKIGEDGYPIYGDDFTLVEGMQIGKLKVIKRAGFGEKIIVKTWAKTMKKPQFYT